MATPTRIVSSEPSLAQERADMTDTMKLLHDHRDALENMIALMQQLHDAGFLEAALSMVEARAQIAQTIIEQALRPEAVRMMQNLLAAAGTLTRIDPETTGDLARSLVAGMNAARAELAHGKPVTVFELARALGDPDVNRGIRFALTFLQGFGKGLRS
jgi:uncharacterized protein YjgD (DUF1641 family)